MQKSIQKTCLNHINHIFISYKNIDAMKIKTTDKSFCAYPGC